MQLLIIRHGIAVERDEFAKSGKSDDLRPLTDTGRRKMRRAAKALRHLVTHPDVLATSPLTRAEQTARIVGEIYDVPVTDVIDALRPESKFELFTKWLAKYPDAELVVAVGHDPHLSGLVSWLISGIDVGGISIKKGGACLLMFDGTPAKGNATMEWLLTPNQLREIGE